LTLSLNQFNIFVLRIFKVTLTTLQCQSELHIFADISKFGCPKFGRKSENKTRFKKFCGRGVLLSLRSYSVNPLKSLNDIFIYPLFIGTKNISSSQNFIVLKYCAYFNMWFYASFFLKNSKHKKTHNPYFINQCKEKIQAKILEAEN
jgi:hypothetical protein